MTVSAANLSTSHPETSQYFTILLKTVVPTFTRHKSSPIREITATFCIRARFSTEIEVGYEAIQPEMIKSNRRIDIFFRSIICCPSVIVFQIRINRNNAPTSVPNISTAFSGRVFTRKILSCATETEKVYNLHRNTQVKRLLSTIGNASTP